MTKHWARFARQLHLVLLAVDEEQLLHKDREIKIIKSKLGHVNTRNVIKWSDKLLLTIKSLKKDVKFLQKWNVTNL